MKSLTLSEALTAILEDNYWGPSLIGSIQREDGSGLSFNYTHVSGSSYYIRFNADTGSILRNTYRDK